MKKKNNFLDYVPMYHSGFSYKENEIGNIEIIRENKGLLRRMTQMLMNKPRVSRIELDALGSFVWRQIDGTKDIYQIGRLVSERFGEKAEPLYERLTDFFCILRKNDFIIYINQGKNEGGLYGRIGKFGTERGI